MRESGYLISFEGGDGAGKSTLIEGLYTDLVQRGIPVFQTRAPGGTLLGEGIRSLLLDKKYSLNARSELFLFLADRADHLEKVIFPALSEGKVVLCDRFNDSTLAYQGVARGLCVETVRSLCLFATDGKIPDLTFYLDVPPAIGLQRTLHKTGEADRIEAEPLAFHEKIRQAFLQIAEEEPQRVRVLDATQSPLQLLQQATQQFNDVFFAHR